MRYKPCAKFPRHYHKRIILPLSLGTRCVNLYLLYHAILHAMHFFLYDGQFLTLCARSLISHAYSRDKILAAAMDAMIHGDPSGKRRREGKKEIYISVSRSLF